MSVAERTGTCLCGAVRLTARGLVPEIGVCHCKRCQRWAGSALVVASVPPDGLTVEGREAVTVFVAPKAERAFCARCGSGLWFRYLDRADAPYDICVGVLDDTDGMTLTCEIYVDLRPGALTYEGDHQRETGAEREARRAREEARDDARG
jgi:hypothetical protein